LKPDTRAYQAIRDYLLGNSTSEDSAFVEEQLLADDDFYQELLIGEDELVEQYLTGVLTDPERESFENYFLLTPERHEKLRFTRNLKRYVSRAKASSTSTADDPNIIRERRASPAWLLPSKRIWPWSNPILSYSLAAAAVIVLSVIGVMIFRVENAPLHSGKTFAVELVPGLSRDGGGIQQVTVPADTETLQLHLKVPNVSAYQTYRAILQAADGRDISHHKDLRRDPASSDRIICPISAALLEPGNYSLKLSGLVRQNEYEDVARYYFHATK
jgi:hypothetical protein